MDIYTFTYSHITKGETIKEQVLGGGFKRRRYYRKTFMSFDDLCKWVIENRDSFESFHIEGAYRESLGDFDKLAHSFNRPSDRDHDTDASILRIR